MRIPTPIKKLHKTNPLFDEFSRKRLTMLGVTFRTRSFEERVEAVRAFREGLMPAIASGRVKPVVDRVFQMAEAEAAQEYMRSNRHFGKIVIVP